MSKDRQLAKARKRCGLTQHDLSRSARVSCHRLAYAETGRISLTPVERERIREVLREAVLRAAEYLHMRNIVIARAVIGDKHAKIIAV